MSDTNVDWAHVMSGYKDAVCPQSKCAICKVAERPDGGKLRKCSGCRVVHYCGRECQALDWPQHKSSCRTCLETRRELKTGVRASRDATCGVCKQSCLTRDDTGQEKVAIALGCGHTAHCDCLIERNEYACPTCGAYAGIPEKEGDGEGLGTSWYNASHPSLILAMALGYIYQAHLVDKTGESGSSEDEMAFIFAHMKQSEGNPDVMTGVMDGARAMRSYVDEIRRCADAGIPITGRGIEYAAKGRRKLTLALITVFVQTKCADEYSPFIVRWLYAAGL